MHNSTTGGRLLVSCLINQRVSHAFGVPGESYLEVLDALYDVQDQIKLTIARQEGGAAFMAEAYGKLTGQPGICFVTRGPGATNASIGVHTAMQNSSPMILFVGQIGRDMRDREAFQEIDFRAFFGSVAKWVTEIDQVDRIPETVARAFSVALSGRPGPVVVSLPEDMLREKTGAIAAPAVKISEPAANDGDLNAACHLLRRANKPLLIVGGGGWSDTGRRDLQRFVDASGIPVAVAFRSQDLIDHRKDSYVGDAGVGMSGYLRDVIAGADTVFALNIRLGESTTDGWSLLTPPRARQKLIHSHGSDRELGKIIQPEMALHAGPNQLCKSLATQVWNTDWKNWRHKARQAFLAMQGSAAQEGALDMRAACAWMRDNLDDDVIVTNGAGNFSVWPSKFLMFHTKMRLLAPQSGAMGAGVPAAVAAAVRYPGRQIVCFAGDGDFQMTMNELGTVAQLGLKVIILIINNGMFGTIRAHQENAYPARVIATDLVNPDFVALARSFGLFGRRVDTTKEFAPAFQGAVNSGTGAVIDLRVNPANLTAFRNLP